MKRGFTQQFSLQTLFSESLPQFSGTLINDQLKFPFKSVQLICTRPQTFHDSHFWHDKPTTSPRNNKSTHTNSHTETIQHDTNEQENNVNNSNVESLQNKTTLTMFSWKFADAVTMLYCWNYLQQLTQPLHTQTTTFENDHQQDQPNPQKVQLLKVFTQYLLQKSLENNYFQNNGNSIKSPSGWLQLAYDPIVSEPSTMHTNIAPQDPSAKVVLVLSAQYSDRFASDIKWSRLLITEIVHKAILAAENIYCSTLGAAYAAMFRDSLNLANAEKAKEFAERQLSVGKRLRDKSLKRKARIYIGYYHIFRKEYQQAQALLDQQLKSAILDEDEDVRKMAEAAIVRCEKDREWETQLLLQTQTQLVIEAAPGPDEENDLMQAD